MLVVFFLLSLSIFVKGLPVDLITKELDQLPLDPKLVNETLKDELHNIIVEEGTLIRGWPTEDTLENVGQISGVSFCPKGYLYIFHRADRTMNERSFDDQDRYIQEENGPIKENTILKMNNKISDPSIINAFGENMFYLPHGIFADKNYIWATDLALHQVLRFPYGSKNPDLILGKRFIPGNDKSHFCKPTHAVTASDGSVFIADGYCNSRIVKFDKSGNYMLQFGDTKGQGQLSLPHHLALIESKDLICVADRENNRIPCYSAGIKDGRDIGKMKKLISDERFGPIYAIGFNEKDNTLYIVSGISNENDKSKVYLYNWQYDLITGTIDFPGPNGFGIAHSISVCPKQECLAIGSLTKECPADMDICLNRMENNENYLPRNIWLYGLIGEQVQLNQN